MIPGFLKLEHLQFNQPITGPPKSISWKIETEFKLLSTGYLYLNNHKAGTGTKHKINFSLEEASDLLI